MPKGNTDQLAAERSYRNRFHRSHDGILGDSKRIDRDGVIGEQAFAEMFNLHDQVQSRHKVDHNFQLADGSRIDVRSSRAYMAKLLVPPQVASRRTIDIYVLVEITRTDAGIVRAWATADEVRAAPIMDVSSRPGAIPAHVINPWDLHPIEELRRRHLGYTLPLFGE